MLAIVAQAVVRVAKRASDQPALVVIAVAAVRGAGLFGVPFPVVVAVAGLAGWALGRWRPPRCRRRARRRRRRAGAGDPRRRPAHRGPVEPAGRCRCCCRPARLGCAHRGGRGCSPARTASSPQQGLFFSGAAVVTFGGAYAVLAYVAQQAVQVYGWLAPGEMVRGLALAETTPGPLIMVVQFVAFLGAYRDPGTLDPWVAAVLASLLVTWVTFVPSFLFVLLGAPYMERLRGNRSLSGGAHRHHRRGRRRHREPGRLLRGPHPVRRDPCRSSGARCRSSCRTGTLRPVSVAIAVVAAVLIFRLRWSVLRTWASAPCSAWPPGSRACPEPGRTRHLPEPGTPLCEGGRRVGRPRPSARGDRAGCRRCGAGSAVGPVVNRAAGRFPWGAGAARRLAVRHPGRRGGHGAAVRARRLRFGLSWELPAFLFLAGVGVLLAVIDLQHRLLPNRSSARPSGSARPSWWSRRPASRTGRRC